MLTLTILHLDLPLASTRIRKIRTRILLDITRSLPRLLEARKGVALHEEFAVVVGAFGDGEGGDAADCAGECLEGLSVDCSKGVGGGERIFGVLGFLGGGEGDWEGIHTIRFEFSRSARGRIWCPAKLTLRSGAADAVATSRPSPAHRVKSCIALSCVVLCCLVCCCCCVLVVSFRVQSNWGCERGNRGAKRERDWWDCGCGKREFEMSR